MHLRRETEFYFIYVIFHTEWKVLRIICSEYSLQYHDICPGTEVVIWLRHLFRDPIYSAEAIIYDTPTYTFHLLWQIHVPTKHKSAVTTAHIPNAHFVISHTSLL